MSLAQTIKSSRNQLKSGHSACAGCAFPSIVRTVMSASEHPLVVSNATGCLEVTSTIYPKSAWDTNYIHTAFESASATISGIETAYNYLLKTKNQDQEFNFLAIGGDGGTYDIGLQSLSGALERGHKFVYLCYDNEGYMNTGGQRSGATPMGATTTTEPAGSKKQGKEKSRKKLLDICIAHDIPYAAQASASNPMDLFIKAKKAFLANGPAVLLVFSPCITVWKFPEGKYVEIAKMAVETRFWPLWEYDSGKYKINYVPQKYVPVEDFLKLQGRFKHLFKSKEGKTVIEKIQRDIDLRWAKLLKLAEI